MIQDVIRGEVRFPLQSIQDFVVRRSDGSPLYNLAVAVDDRDMGVTHVIRGDDHLSNTPRQALILDALGAERPVYAHLPLLYGPDGKKLSKRHGAASVQELRDEGYLPEAVRNYIALLGWGDEESSTIMSTDELVERFDLSRVSKSPAVFDVQKLRWMNGRYMRELPVEDLRGRLEETVGREIPAEAVAISQEKMQTLAEFWPLAGFLVEPQEVDEKAWAKVMGDGAGDRLLAARQALEERGAVRRRRGGERPARRGGHAGGQATGRVPAGPRGHQRHHRVTGHLRVGGGARSRGDAVPHGPRAGAGPLRTLSVACRILNLYRSGCR